MKKVISVTLVIALLLTVLSLPATARASTHIASYSIDIFPRGNGRVEVIVSVIGTHRNMTRIGFPSIALFESTNNGSTWTPVRSTGSWNPNTPAGSHTHTFTYQGVAGRWYYASASFWAQDTQGHDSKSANSRIITAT